MSSRLTTEEFVKRAQKIHGKKYDYSKVEYYNYDSTERFPKSVLTFATDKQKEALHPTQKPVALIEYLISLYTNEGDTVLDNVMGSGTTGIACLNLNRNFIGIEKDEKYFEMAEDRIKQRKAWLETNKI